jgi:hypothetical protein
MAKRINRPDLELVKVAKEHALELLKQAFAEARDTGKAGGPEGKPPLFQNGIEYLRVKFGVGIADAAKIAIELELAGPKSPQGAV